MTTLIYKKNAFLDGGKRNVFLTNISDDSFVNLAIIDLLDTIPEYLHLTNETANIEINSHWSRSGCTGEGKIKSRYPLFEIGTYRTDCKCIDFKQDQVFNDLKIFVPIANGKTIKELLFYQNNYPIVVSFEEKILMLSIYEFFEFIKNWVNKTIEFKMKEIQFEYWDFTSNTKYSDDILYYKNKSVKGVDIIPFCYLLKKRLDEQRDEVKLDTCQSKILNALGVRKIQEYINEYRNTDYDRKFCFTGKYGETISIYDENEEKEIIELLVNNDSIKEYHDDNQTYYYYRKGNKLIVENHDLSYEYEIYLQDVDLLLTPVIEKVKFAIEQIKEKIKTDIYNKKYNEIFSSGIKDVLANNLEIIFTVQDSYDVGNCEPGTKRFLKQFSLKESISAKELIENENLEKMLNDYQFVRVIEKKLAKELIK